MWNQGNVLCSYGYCTDVSFVERDKALQTESKVRTFVVNASTCMVTLWPEEPSIRGTNYEVQKFNVGVEGGMYML